jgi:hypothetical protein
MMLLTGTAIASIWLPAQQQQPEHQQDQQLKQQHEQDQLQDQEHQQEIT